MDIFLLSASNSGSNTNPESLLNDSSESEREEVSLVLSPVSWITSIDPRLLSLELIESSLERTIVTRAVRLSLSKLMATRLPRIALICASSLAMVSSGSSGALLLFLLFSKKLRREPERFSSLPFN
uniref:Uncharacterized protein n=1 Tax=Amphimedon queenslandica TaxID=400682 RepID=A0A1X7UJE0_AMPQE